VSAPVASTVASLYDLQAELLGFCAAALAELPQGAPDRQYVAMGAPVLDCEQLTVHCYQIGEGQTSPATLPLDRARRAVTFPRINMAFLVVTIARECYPGPTGASLNKPPDPAALNAAAAILCSDAWLLWNAVPAALRAGELWGGCNFTAWEPLLPLQPSGKIAGWTFPLQVKIDGYSPDLPA
jgi:hypothetical protein